MKPEPELSELLIRRERHREYCRNAYRIKKGIPPLAPKWSTTTGRPPRGTIKRQISLTPSQWRNLDELRGGQTRGDFLVAKLEL